MGVHCLTGPLSQQGERHKVRMGHGVEEIISALRRKVQMRPGLSSLSVWLSFSPVTRGLKDGLDSFSLDQIGQQANLGS